MNRMEAEEEPAATESFALGRKRDRPSETESMAMLRNIERNTKKILSTAYKQKLSLGLLTALDDAFKCCICYRSPCTPPVIACRSCSTLLGCQSCLDQLFNGSMTQPCPKCREPRGIANTFILKGFDDVIRQTAKLEESSDDSDGSENENEHH